ncbi:MAG: GTP-binding protein [Candidatus Woesebacteria bacterium]|nr:MAG: GTP-binding protein [Candidatus Woesebacteria bacterium]
MQKTASRPPVIAVLGHVDHGKTTLLDKIRKTNIASREAGGITQSIGACVVKTKEDENITFIDTPGHAAFTKMRSRGTLAADIAILVVAADDGVMPQTKEALQIIRDSKVPFLIAITKIDLPSANVENALVSLEKEGVFFEKRGGDTPFAEVSGKTGKGVDELLELLSLIWQVNESKSTSPNLSAIVIESEKGKGGVVATVIVKEGSLKVGQQISNDKMTCKVRGLFDENQKSIKEVLPGFPAQILGFDESPQVGSIIHEGVKVASSLVSKIENKLVENKLSIFVKAKKDGNLEALLNSIPDNFQVIGSGVGDVTQSDITLAKSAGALGIFTFESKASPQVAKLAESDGVNIYSFRIIYELLKKLEELGKTDTKQILGKAEIRAIFPFDGKRVAGVKISLGKFTKNIKTNLMRKEEKIAEVRIVSLRKQKEEVSELKEGEVGGILFVPQLDFAIDDVLLSLEK